MADVTLPTEGPRDGAAAGAVPTRLGRYDVLGVIGRGGMGAVYEARDPELGRRVAIKVLRDHLAAGDRDMLRREAQALARPVHPNVIEVYDVGASDTRVFVVMQLVDGAPIDAWAKTTAAPPRAVAAAFCKAGRGIAAAHAAGLVHGDVKPANILVARDGAVRIGDFGIAALPSLHTSSDAHALDDTVPAGPAYVAPEQAAGGASAASDQVGFAASLWEVLVGARPSAEPAARAATPARMPAYVHAALVCALSPTPADRFPSMTVLVDALAPRPGRRRTGAIAAVVAVVGAGIAVIAGSDAFRDSPPAMGPIATAPPPAAPPAPVHAPGRPDLRAIHALTSFGPRTCAYSPVVVAPDQVVFDLTQEEDVDLYTVPLAGGRPEQLTSAPSWEWRANRGRRAGEVIYLITDLDHDHRTQIAALNLATHVESLLGVRAANEALAIGDVIYYTQGPEIRRIVDGHDKSLVTVSPALSLESFAASPDGARLAVLELAGDVSTLCLVDVAAMLPRCVLKDIASGRPAFSTDGNSVYYNGGDGIHRVDVVTDSDALFLANVGGYGGLAIAPDGSALVLSTCAARSHIVDAGVQPHRQLVDEESARAPTVANDGTLAYVAVRRNRPAVMVQRPNGTGTQVTNPDVVLAHSPAISPDATRVAFVALSPRPGIHVGDATDAEASVQLTDGSDDADPIWVDAQHVAFTRTGADRVSSVFVVPSKGGVATRVAQSGVAVAARQGELLVVSSGHASWVDPVTQRQRPFTATSPADTVGATISPSGRWIAYEVGSQGHEVWRLDLADPAAKLELVTRLPTGDSAEKLAIRNDGHVIITPITWSGDLVVVPAVDGTRF